MDSSFELLSLAKRLLTAHLVKIRVFKIPLFVRPITRIEKILSKFIVGQEAERDELRKQLDVFHGMLQSIQRCPVLYDPDPRYSSGPWDCASVDKAVEDVEKVLARQIDHSEAGQPQTL